MLDECRNMCAHQWCGLINHDDAYNSGLMGVSPLPQGRRGSGEGGGRGKRRHMAHEEEARVRIEDGLGEAAHRRSGVGGWV